MPPEGSRTTCPHCGSTVSPTLRFCPQCGKPLFTGTLCSSCGAELVPGIRFCRQCGSRIPEQAGVSGKGSVPAPEQAGKPVGSMSPARISGPSPPVPGKAGGPGLKKIAVFIIGAVIVIFMALIVIGLLLPDDPDENPGLSGSPAPGSPVTADLRPSSQDIEERETVRSAAVTALRQGNQEGVIALLIQDDQEKYQAGNGISAEDMKMVAAAIDTATVTEETFRTAIYRTRIGDTDYSFMAVREGGTWKLSGI